MRYLSTTETAEKWNISPRRVAKLASEGRIEGAIIVGNSWMIPDIAPKPEDGRKKSNRPECDDRYIFPDLIYCFSSNDDPNELPPDEKQLYDGIVQFCKTEYAECIRTLDALLQKTERLCLKIGAYYYLTMAYIVELQFDKAVEAFDTCNRAITSADRHQDELLLIKRELDSVIYGTSQFSEPLEIDIDSCYSKGFLPFLAEENAYSDVCSLYTDAPRNTTASHEIICMELERNGYFHAAMLIHLYLSIMYSFFRNENKRDLHIRKAVDLTLKHENYSLFALFLVFYQEGILVIKKYYPKETVDLLQKASNTWLRAYPAYLKYHINFNTLLDLTELDYTLLFWARTGSSINQMALLEDVSVSTIKKQLGKLYRKMDVRNKRELLEKFSREVHYMRQIH